MILRDLSVSTSLMDKPWHPRPGLHIELRAGGPHSPSLRGYIELYMDAVDAQRVEHWLVSELMGHASLCIAPAQAAGQIAVADATADLADRPLAAPAAVDTLRSMPFTHLGSMVRRERLARGFSRAALAGMAGVDSQTLRVFEEGTAKPHRATMQKIVAALDLDPMLLSVYSEEAA